MIYYDRQGQPITADEWCRHLESAAYHRVAKGEVVDGSGTTTNVSTVWLGLDHGFGSGRLEIFETMVFGGRYDHELVRYATEGEALEGHRRTMADLADGRPPWWLG